LRTFAERHYDSSAGMLVETGGLENRSCGSRQPLKTKQILLLANGLSHFFELTLIFSFSPDFDEL